jgi:WD40 repeat protein
LDEFDEWWVEGMTFSPDGAHIAAIDQNGVIRVWRLASCSLELSIQGSYWNKSVSWSPDGRFIASGGLDGEQLWTIAT